MNPMHGRGWREVVQRLVGRRRDRHREVCLELGADGTWSAVVGRTPIAVRCVLGVALVTCEGDPEDHVLSAGETFTAARPGRLALWALEPARLRVDTAGERVRGREGKVRRGSRLREGTVA